MYKEDYIVHGDKFMKNEVTHNTSDSLEKYVRINIDDNKKVKYYTSIKNIAEDLNLKSASHVSSCCKGKKKFAYGYKWMYKEDYNQYIEEQNQVC